MLIILKSIFKLNSNNQVFILYSYEVFKKNTFSDKNNIFIVKTQARWFC